MLIWRYYHPSSISDRFEQSGPGSASRFKVRIRNTKYGPVLDRSHLQYYKVWASTRGAPAATGRRSSPSALNSRQGPNQSLCNKQIITGENGLFLFWFSLPRVDHIFSPQNLSLISSTSCNEKKITWRRPRLRDNRSRPGRGGWSASPSWGPQWTSLARTPSTADPSQPRRNPPYQAPPSCTPRFFYYILM